MIKTLFAINSHDAEYVHELNEQGDLITESDNGPSVEDYGNVQGNVIIASYEFSSEEDLEIRREKTAKEYHLQTDSIVVYRLV